MPGRVCRFCPGIRAVPLTRGGLCRADKGRVLIPGFFYHNIERMDEMGKYIAKRIAYMALVFLIVSFLMYALYNLSLIHI